MDMAVPIQKQKLYLLQFINYQTAVITAPATACLRDSTVFSSTSSTGGSGNTVTMWNWDFGGGVTSTLQNPKHAYTTTGVKTVTLTVTSDKGCISAPLHTTLH
jgi:hypothetical protein